MYICVHECVYLYINVCINIYIYLYIYIYYMYLYVYLYIYICIYIRNAIVRLPYLRSGDSQGQETFSATSAEKQTRNHDTVLIEYIEYRYIG